MFKNILINGALLCSLFLSCYEPDIQLIGHEIDFCSKIHREKMNGISEQFLDISSVIKDKTGVYV